MEPITVFSPFHFVDKRLCSNCHTELYLMHTTRHGTELLRCPSCGFSYVHPRARERVEFAQAIQESEDDIALPETTVSLTEYQKAVNVVNRYRCKKGFRPTLCHRDEDGRCSEPTCQRERDAYALILRVTRGELTLVAGEGGWQL
jgi:hypothetical protein